MTTDPAPATTDPANPGTISSTINTSWKRKMILFVVALLALGVYGLFDAAYAYPRRGYHAAELLERDFLKYLQDTGKLDNKSASITDPVGELKRAQDATSGADRLIQAWLEQLQFVGKLNPAHTTLPRTDFFHDGVSQGGPIASAEARLEALKRAPHAEPLHSYDIPVQWLICAVGLVWGLYIVFLVLRVSGRVYSWNPAEKRLTLPGGDSFTPADILEIDKRKWHKLFVSITLKPTHPTLAGKTLELDLLRFVPLEEWVLDMERVAFPDDAAHSAGQEPESTQAQ